MDGFINEKRFFNQLVPHFTARSIKIIKRGGGAMDKMRLAVIVAALVLLATSSCTRKQLGLPRTQVSAKSPDGRFVAFVRNHPNFDPPDQSIWLGPLDGRAKKLRHLAGDQDWCNTIVWSADSSTVGFLVQDARLITVDAVSGQIVSEKWLVDWRGEYRPSQMAEDLSLSPDGHSASFRVCEHRSGECSEIRTIAIQKPRASR